MAYEYEKPRRPTSLDCTGPGPTYFLPPLTGFGGHDPRSSHRRGPSWHFGSRQSDSNLSHSAPGPIYHVKNEHSGRSFSILPRLDQLKSSTETPGPAAYYPAPKGPYCRQPNLSFSFLRRTERADCDGLPGPNNYMLPSTVGASKRVPTLKGRTLAGSFDRDFKKTPGPAQYSIAASRSSRGPFFTIKSRTERPNYNFLPGPDVYNPKMVTGGPSFSFGIRHPKQQLPVVLID